MSRNGRNHLRSKLANWDLFDTTGMTRELRKSLYWVIWGVTLGMFATVVTTGASWTGFQREILQANDFQLGLIAAIPVAANVLQLPISYYMEKKRNRRFLFLCLGLIGRFFWIPVALLPYLIPQAQADLRIVTVIALVGFISSGNCFVNLGFASLMGDLVPIRIRGQYFSARQKVYLVAGVVVGLIVSSIVDHMGNAGYTVVLVLAGISGMLDIFCFFFVKWPPMAAPPDTEQHEGIGKILKGILRDQDFMRLTLFFICWHFAVNVSAPFFNVYMLENLQMSYTQITLFTQIVSNIVTVLSVSRWGRMLDGFGNKPMMQLACRFCMFIPILWVFMGPETSWLVIISNIITGCFWPIIDLGQQNLYLLHCPQKNRSIYIAVFFAAYNLLGIALGNAVGGWVSQNVFTGWAASQKAILGFTLNKYHYVFLLGAVLRILVVMVLLPMLREKDAVSTKAMLTQCRQDGHLRYTQFRVQVIRQRLRRKLRKEMNREIHESEE